MVALRRVRTILEVMPTTELKEYKTAKQLLVQYKQTIMQLNNNAAATQASKHTCIYKKDKMYKYNKDIQKTNYTS